MKTYDFKEKGVVKTMAKFKVWDRVRVKPIYYGTEERNKIGVIHFIDVLKHYQVVFDDTKKYYSFNTRRIPRTCRT